MKNIIVQGILFDEKSSMERGTAQAPPIIRKALNSGYMNLFAENDRSIENDCIDDFGDINISDYIDIESITLNHLKPRFN